MFWSESSPTSSKLLTKLTNHVLEFFHSSQVDILPRVFHHVVQLGPVHLENYILADLLFSYILYLYLCLSLSPGCPRPAHRRPHQGSRWPPTLCTASLRSSCCSPSRPSGARWRERPWELACFCRCWHHFVLNIWTRPWGIASILYTSTRSRIITLGIARRRRSSSQISQGSRSMASSWSPPCTAWRSSMAQDRPWNETFLSYDQSRELAWRIGRPAASTIVGKMSTNSTRCRVFKPESVRPGIASIRGARAATLRGSLWKIQEEI